MGGGPRLDRGARIQVGQVHFGVFSMSRFVPPALSSDWTWPALSLSSVISHLSFVRLDCRALLQFGLVHFEGNRIFELARGLNSGALGDSFPIQGGAGRQVRTHIIIIYRSAWWRNVTDKQTPHQHNIEISITRPKLAYGRQDLVGVSLRASGAQLGFKPTLNH